MNFRKWVRKGVLQQQAYAAEVIDCRIKLDANENPCALSPSLQEAFLDRVRDVRLNRYPDAGAPLIRKRFARHYGVGEDMLMVGNGSDELIQILCAAMARRGAALLIPVPTFAMYRISGLNYGYRVVEVPLDAGFDLDVNAMAGAAFKKMPALTFLSYPNNPTGNCFSADRMEAVLDQSRGIVVVDEAYFNFSGKTFLPLIDRHDNLVILRTLSKVGFAAMRVGFLIGQPGLVHELDKVRLPYNLNALSQLAAGFFLDHEAVFMEQIDAIVGERNRLWEKLKNLDGVQPFRSDANFIFFSCAIEADDIYRKLLLQGILVKPFQYPRGGRSCIRVTVGTTDENEAFIEALRSVIAK